MFAPRLVAPLAILLATASPALTATLHVPADYATIQSALDAASPGDVVQVAAGEYEATGLLMRSGVTLRGNPADPASVVITGQTPDYQLTAFDLDEPVAVLGVRFQSGKRALNITRSQITIEDCEIHSFNGGYGWTGKGIHAFEATVIVRRCKISHVSAWHHQTGSGAGASFSTSIVDIEDTVFRQNAAAQNGSGLSAWRCTITLTGCQFFDNSVGGYDSGGACTFWDCDAIVRRSIFAGSGWVGGAVLAIDDANVQVIGCSFWDNGDGVKTTTYFGGNPTLVMNRCALGGDDRIYLNSSTVADISCTTVQSGWALAPDYENINGNITADPLFCDAAAGNFHLQWGSPCLPENSNGCDLIGAFGYGGCNSVSVDPSTWSEVKSWYR